jgi:hypothetical protein
MYQAPTQDFLIEEVMPPCFSPLARKWDITCQQLVLAEQPGILESLEIRQVAQRVETEVQEAFRGDIG